MKVSIRRDEPPSIRINGQDTTQVMYTFDLIPETEAEHFIVDELSHHALQLEDIYAADTIEMPLSIVLREVIKES